MKNNINDWTRKVEEHYNKNADEWIIETEKVPNKYYYGAYFNILFKSKLFNRDITKAKALDVGCGSGIFAFKLCKCGFKKVYALDISEGMLLILKKEIKRRSLTNVKLIKGDVENLPFENNNFDFVVLNGVMECLNDQDKAMKEIYRVLKPGGTASIRWLNKEGLWGCLEFIKRILKIPSGPFSSNFSKIEDAVLKLKRAGFRIDNIDGAIILPLFIFPFPVSWLLENLLIRTGIAYMIEGLKNNNEKFIRGYYYSFWTEVSK